MKKLFLSGILVLILSVLSYGKGIKAYNFQLKDENGKIVKLEDFKGNVVLVIFWHPLCGSCRAFMPELNLLYEKFKGKPVKFLAVNMGDENGEEIKKIKEKWGFDIPVLLDGKSIKSQYRVIGTPIVYFLRKDLTIDKILYGRTDISKVEKVINNLLKE